VRFSGGQAVGIDKELEDNEVEGSEEEEKDG
jgi:hypothetical protein